MTTTPAEQAARAIARTVRACATDEQYQELIAAILAYGAEREATTWKAAIEVCKSVQNGSAFQASSLMGRDRQQNGRVEGAAECVDLLESAAKENC